MRTPFVIASFILLAICAALIWVWPHFAWAMIVIFPLIAVGFYDMSQTHHSLMRNFPLLGRLRWVAEWMRPKMYQYFVESDTDEPPLTV